MARVLQNTVTIAAPTTAVWAVLTAFDERPEWDPYYREVHGELAVGARLTVRASLNDTSRPVTSRPRIVAVEPGRHLAWTNRFGLPGLLDSRNDFRLGSPAPGVTAMSQTERFSGLLVTPARRMLNDVEARLGQWVAALKLRAEERSGPSRR